MKRRLVLNCTVWSLVELLSGMKGYKSIKIKVLWAKLVSPAKGKSYVLIQKTL